MNETSDDPPLLVRIRSWARTKARASKFNPFGTDEPRAGRSDRPVKSSSYSHDNAGFESKSDRSSPSKSEQEKEDVADKRTPNIPPPAPPPNVAKERDGKESSTIENGPRPKAHTRFWNVAKTIILSSWINWLLLFVPVGIGLGALGKAKGEHSPVSPTVVFAMNAIAIIPLASLLCLATESVASKLGDTWGALMNVTFGNAVELIIFIIALAADEIRIVQASLLGSILANLLLILGMCFLFGGLRFREQVRRVERSVYQADIVEALQFHCVTDERVSTQSKCYEPVIACKLRKSARRVMLIEFEDSFPRFFQQYGLGRSHSRQGQPRN
ncbi:MAG: hypothetical protein Q9160_005051 [Pyrenula sp. 1 TL-2023]